MSATLRTSNVALSQRMQFLARGMLFVMLLGWVAAFYPFDDLLDRQGTPFGADFSMFYVAGQVVNTNSQSLYDQAEHQRVLHATFPNLRSDFCLPYRYPPFVAIVVSPFSKLPYAAAYALFFCASLAVWLLSIRSLRRMVTTGHNSDELPGSHNTTGRVDSLWFSLAAWPVALETLIGGQASMFGLGIAVAALSLVRGNRCVAAGAVLALAAYKPNVLALFAVGLMIRYPRILLGFVPTAIILAAMCYWSCGWSACEQYFAVLTQLSGNAWDVATPFWKIQGLEPWIGLVTEKSRLLTVAAGIALSIAVGIRWRMHRSDEASAFAESVTALLVINALFNAYTPIYDLVLLAPAIVLAAWRFFGARSREHGTTLSPFVMQILIIALFFGPHLSQATAKMIGVQLFPIILLWIGIWLGRRGLRPSTGSVQFESPSGATAGLPSRA